MLLDDLVLIFKELAVIAGIVLLCVIIISMVSAPIVSIIKKKKHEKEYDKFIDILIKEGLKQEKTRTKKKDEK